MVLAVIGCLIGLSYAVPYKRNFKRYRQIKAILADLEALRDHPDYQDAVNINIEFFRVLRFPLSYLWWLMFRAPRLRRERLRIRELADLPFPGWQDELLETLSWFEIWMGRILRPIRQEIIRELERLRKIKKEPIVIASFGCGGMELERQILYQLLRSRFNFPLLVIGVDYSPAIKDVISRKFANLVSKGMLEIETASRLGADDLNKMKERAKGRRFSIVLFNTDAFELQALPENSFDLVYHTRLRHHLSLEERDRLDKLTIHLAPKFMELDDVYNIPGIMIESTFLWRFPVVLNGGIFSYLRDFSKKELKTLEGRGWQVNIYGRLLPCYLRVYEKGSGTNR
ncbi:MAG: class I SAM-dependent methyltransferase [Dehalococcoidales bacterium]|nr:class I SAM-dependent methyltransferase [Dehalococcoidales bacterium]